MYVLEELFLLLMIQGICMRDIVKRLFGLESRKYNFIFCLQADIQE